MNGEDIAVQLMRNLLYDNGMVNRQEPEYIDPEWVEKIAPIAGKFFSLYPRLLTDDDLDEICCGEESEVQAKYGSLEGFKELDEVLRAYFQRDDYRYTKI